MSEWVSELFINCKQMENVYFLGGNKELKRPPVTFYASIFHENKHFTAQCLLISSFCFKRPYYGLFFFLNRCIREVFIFMIGLGFKRIDEGLFSQCWDFAEQIHFWVICHSFLFPLLFWCFWVPSVGNLKIKSLLFNSEALNNHKLVAILGGF